MKSIIVALVVSLAACGPESTTPSNACEDCSSQTSGLANCNQNPPPPACTPSEPPENTDPPPSPPQTLAPSSGTYEGYATIVGHVGPITAGCWPISTPYAASKLFVRLVITNGTPDDGTAHITMESNAAENYRFASWTDQLGGSSAYERQDRSYQLVFSADALQITGSATYRNNDAAGNRAQCSGYSFTMLYRKVP